MQRKPRSVFGAPPLCRFVPEEYQGSKLGRNLDGEVSGKMILRQSESRIARGCSGFAGYRLSIVDAPRQRNRDLEENLLAREDAVKEYNQVPETNFSLEPHLLVTTSG